VVNSRGQLVPAVSIPFACEEARQKGRPNFLHSQPRHVSEYIGSSQYSHSSSVAAAFKGSSNYALSESKHFRCGCSGRCATCCDCIRVARKVGSLVMWWHQVGQHVDGPKLQLLQSSHTRMSSKNWFHQAVRFVPHPVEAQTSSH